MFAYIPMHISDMNKHKMKSNRLLIRKVHLFYILQNICRSLKGRNQISERHLTTTNSEEKKTQPKPLTSI